MGDLALGPGHGERLARRYGPALLLDEAAPEADEVVASEPAPERVTRSDKEVASLSHSLAAMVSASWLYLTLTVAVTVFVFAFQLALPFAVTFTFIL